jgi:hypothetical protein
MSKAGIIIGIVVVVVLIGLGCSYYDAELEHGDRYVDKYGVVHYNYDKPYGDIQTGFANAHLIVPTPPNWHTLDTVPDGDPNRQFTRLVTPSDIEGDWCNISDLNNAAITLHDEGVIEDVVKSHDGDTNFIPWADRGKHVLDVSLSNAPTVNNGLPCGGARQILVPEAALKNLRVNAD